MKIVIALLVPILLGIVVGSNLSSVMTIVILNQPTIALPIGVWLLIAVGLGLLSSSLIQVGIWIDRRLLKRQIRQLQTRLQRSDEDIFTYTSSSAKSVAVHMAWLRYKDGATSSYDVTAPCLLCRLRRRCRRRGAGRGHMPAGRGRTNKVAKNWARHRCGLCWSPFMAPFSA